MTMTNTKRWIEDVCRVDPPELWPEVERRAAHVEIPQDRGRRGVEAAAVLVVALALMGALLYALRGLGPRVVAGPGPGQIVRYRMGGPPQPLAVGEGAAWAAVYHATRSSTGEPTIFRIDESTGRITPASGTLGAEWMAAGDAGVWATCNVRTCGGPAALLLDPSSGEVVRSVSLPSRAHHIAVGLGSVWVTTDSGLVRIDPTHRGRVWTTFEGSFTWVGVSDDSVWATTDRGVERIDPLTGEVTTSFSFPDPCYFDATPATVFVSSCGGGLPAGSGPDELVALDAGTGSVKYRIALDGWGQMRVARGTLWIAGNDPANPNFIRLVPFDASTGEPAGRPFEIERGVERSFPEIFPPSVFFAVGEDSIWLTDFPAGEVIRVGLPISGTGMPTTSGAPTLVESPSGEPSSYRAEQGIDIGARVEAYAGTVSVGGGSLWLVSDASDALIRMDPESGATTTTTVPDAQAVAYGNESVWVTTTSGELYQVDPATSAVVHTTSVASGGGTVAVAGGRTWVGDDSNGKVYAVDASTRQVLFSRQVGYEGGDGMALAAAGDSVWVWSTNGPALSRIDATTGDVRRFGFELAPGDRDAIASGQGSIWLASNSSGDVARIDPDASTVVGTWHVAPETPATGPGLEAVVAGDGAAWAMWTSWRAVPGTKNEVRTLVNLTRIDAASGEMTAARTPVIGPNEAPPRLVAVLDGTLWWLGRGGATLYSTEP
jgi:hypothetical protein